MVFATIENALKVIASGGMVIVVDDEGRENEGDVVMAAEFATTEALTFMVSRCRGIVCAPMPEPVARRLELPLMVERNTDSMKTAFTVSVDLIAGITTGVSAAERALTLRALSAPETKAESLARPGHIFPLIARQGGVEERAGHTEAAVDLAELAGLSPVGIICEILKDDGSMARRADLEIFARDNGLIIISIADLIAWKARKSLQFQYVRPSLVA
ncbi:3,4-dihydroxy-2-butanone 4-phosphate synthase [Pseudomonas sp. GM41(2012)]|uniref:3,4-dihydroxy-2-butanone-4-phosphate synthase n=1 Tax=Pseudomonas sp. (strain GM41(2012)) TaxID=1144708 RepID=UPI0002704AD8|nr:3,4-dihydroxy-2-butanone-4-phosphate synthase [Pseudomonas sp. GM41(2012)]EUB76057.1 3,4-dihydroxy-2-butanone 4-phosphate synthase [Pseudomonas sp. GM41(2012)]